MMRVWRRVPERVSAKIWSLIVEWRRERRAFLRKEGVSWAGTFEIEDFSIYLIN